MKIYSTILMFLGITICSVFAAPPPVVVSSTVHPAFLPYVFPGPIILPSVIPPYNPPFAEALSSPNVGDEDKTHGKDPSAPNPATAVNPDAIPGRTPYRGGVSPPLVEPPVAADDDPNNFVTDDPNSLMPVTEEAPSAVLSSQLSGSRDKESQAKELIRYKEVRVRAEKDPAIQLMYIRAQRAPTEEGYRAAMREYYRMLFKKIEKLDPSLTNKSRGMLEAYLRRLAQTHIEPTIPLQPPPTPEPL